MRFFLSTTLVPAKRCGRPLLLAALATIATDTKRTQQSLPTMIPSSSIH